MAFIASKSNSVTISSSRGDAGEGIGVDTGTAVAGVTTVGVVVATRPSSPPHPISSPTLSSSATAPAAADVQLPQFAYLPAAGQINDTAKPHKQFSLCGLPFVSVSKKHCHALARPTTPDTLSEDV